jgi:hypothetical protein
MKKTIAMWTIGFIFTALGLAFLLPNVGLKHQNLKAEASVIGSEEVFEYNKKLSGKRMSQEHLNVDIAVAAYLRFVSDFHKKDAVEVDEYLRDQIQLSKESDRSALIRNANLFVIEADKIQTEAKRLDHNGKNKMAKAKAKLVKTIQKNLHKDLTPTGWAALDNAVEIRVMGKVTIHKQKFK